MHRLFSLSTLAPLLAVIGLAFTSCTEIQKTTPAESVSSQKSNPNAFYPTVPVKADSPSSLGSKTDRHGYPVYAVTDKKRYVRTTAYSDAENEMGGIYKNYNAAGTFLKYGKVRSAAADWSIYPLGTLFKIKGLPHTYVVDDYGSALVGAGSVDIYHPSLKLMNKWGTRPAEIQIIKMGDWDRSAYLLKGRIKYAHCKKMYYGVLANQKKYGNNTAQAN